ncbi:hypothetical protein ACFFQF_11715 [Haladaptatus pallidirubidus]|uniref:hypothetical protein n=1 Tax=Haladaptatus pallidirubidus TaxID=1008152 RepID=UPI001D1094FD|nr:hypothetical protein [Haladaptatus pallidirubidus]
MAKPRVTDGARPFPTKFAGERVRRCAALARQATGRTGHCFRKDDFPPKTGRPSLEWAGQWPARSAGGSGNGRPNEKTEYGASRR